MNCFRTSNYNQRLLLSFRSSSICI